MQNLLHQSLQDLAQLGNGGSQERLQQVQQKIIQMSQMVGALQQPGQPPNQMQAARTNQG